MRISVQSLRYNRAPITVKSKKGRCYCLIPRFQSVPFAATILVHFSQVGAQFQRMSAFSEKTVSKWKKSVWINPVCLQDLYSCAGVKLSTAKSATWDVPKIESLFAKRRFAALFRCPLDLLSRVLTLLLARGPFLAKKVESFEQVRTTC